MKVVKHSSRSIESIIKVEEKKEEVKEEEGKKEEQE
jgi:hypothetical protein